MFAAALLIPFLASAAEAQVLPTSSIRVTGHAWAPFISPVGEPFRARTAADDTLANWFYQADRNRDGVVTLDEMQADADRYFAALDSDHDGQIDPDELAHYELEIAPDIQVMSRTMPAPGAAKTAAVATDGDQDAESAPQVRRQRKDDDRLGLAGGLQGAARYSLLNIPEPVAAADTNFDRAISLQEFRQAAAARFELLDKAGQGKLTLAELELLRPPEGPVSRRTTRDVGKTDKRIGNPLPPGN